MAKKKKQLTIEEKLQEALIPLEEQLYDLPSNWEWVKLENILKKLTDGSHFSPKILDKGMPYITVKDLTDGEIDFINCKKISEEDYKKLKDNGCQPLFGDVLFSKDGTVGKTSLIDYEKEFVVLSSLAILRSDKSIIESNFLEVILRSPQIMEQALNSKTGTAIRRVVLKHLKLLKFPIPPLNEQKRIVAKLENMLAKTREAKEKIQEAKETFELRRASILHKAFTGELTAKWREENLELIKDGADKLLEQINEEKLKKWEEECEKAEADGKRKPKKPKLTPVDEMEIPKGEQPYELPEGWKWVRLGEISNVGTGSTPLKSNKLYYENADIPWLTSKQTGEKKIVSAVNFITKFAIEDKNMKIYPKHTLLVAMYGEGKTRGQVAEMYISGAINQACAAISLIDYAYEINQYIFNFFIKSYYDIRKLAMGGNQPNLNLTTVKNTKIPLPSLDEQKEIIRIIEEILEAEAKAKDLLDMEKQIDLIEKSILSKAFRGELNTGDENDEPAIELLKRVLEEAE